MSTTESLAETTAESKWKPLNRIQRRIVGVLVEKAKTTPDAYPLSLNGLTTGCNQKSNRSPQMDLSTEQVEDQLDGLRAMGAVAEVQSTSRVAKYRHYMKDWLNVSGPELAVMAELLLRGEQTVGELRGRATRMASGQLPDLNSLRPVLTALMERGLVVALTAEGRGQIVTHGLYLPDELERVKQKSSREAASSPAAPEPTRRVVSAPTPDATQSASTDDIGALRQEISELRNTLARVEKEIENLWSNIR